MGIQLLSQIEHPVSFKEPENLALCNNYLGRNIEINSKEREGCEHES